MNSDVVVSFFDYSGNAVREWAELGYEAMCFDLAHKVKTYEPVGSAGGGIWYVPADLSPDGTGWDIARRMVGIKRTPAMVFGFPPCTDLAVSGAKHFATKWTADPTFQVRAVAMARQVEDMAKMWGSPYVIENPRSVLSTLWRKPDHKFDPCDFGGYLPADDAHPTWPDYIAPRDAYTKDTWLWAGGGFVMPNTIRVEPEVLERVTKSGRTIRGSRQFMKLGGSSFKTKTIRNETPRGFARAVLIANI